MSKRKVLFCGEASWLSTGFAKFNREIIKGLHATGKYEIAEMGSYGSERDENARKLPWKFYGVIPNNEQEAQVYKSDQRHAFGGYKIDGVLLDFQPDIVFDARDPWMFAHIVGSRLRPNFKLFLMPTVDSAPQRKEWITDLFSKADALTTYSRFGKRVLESEGLKVSGVTSPGVDLEIFKPIPKNVVKDKHCLVEDLFIFGTVMRNQKRKLYPDLFAAYAALRNRYRKEGRKASKRQVELVQHSALLCHTSWPDVGWDIPDLLYRFSIQRHVIFVYKCDSCKSVFTSWFIPTDQKGMAQCRICGEHKAHMPNTHGGVSDTELAEIYNLMDVYIQPAICEGWALPITEAKACGIPGLYQNYSAMEDHVENGGGLPIKVGRFYHESETMSLRSLPDIDDMVSGMESLIFDEKKRNRLSKEARLCAEQKHNWNTTVGIVENILDNMPINNRAKTWDRPPEINEINMTRPPAGLTDEQFVVWCYVNILGRKPDEKGFNDWMNSLHSGNNRDSVENFFRNEIATGNAIEIRRFQKSQELRGVLTDIEEEEQQTAVNGVLL